MLKVLLVASVVGSAFARVTSTTATIKTTAGAGGTGTVPVTPTGKSITINSPNDFISFAESINSRKPYYGTTVLLEKDLIFNTLTSQKFSPIGNSTNVAFQGTFDGQGHMISGLNVTSASQYVGLFGYSSGATIRNVVMQNTCTMTSTYNGTGSQSSSQFYLGGIVGYCPLCVIENCVNMGR